MGKYVTIDDERVYQQEDGEITAWLTGFEEKAVLRHEGSQAARHIFYLCVAASVIYLVVVFFHFGH